MKFLVLLWLVAGARAAKILAVFPTASYSHQVPLQFLARSLAARGHQVTVLSPNPLQNPPANYINVDLSVTYDFVAEKFKVQDLRNLSPLDLMVMLSGLFAPLCEVQINTPGVQELLRSGEKFDLMVLEHFGYYCYLGLGYRLGNPPVVAALTVGVTPLTMDTMGNPQFPSISPDMSLPHTDHMTFVERVKNLYYNLRITWESKRSFIPPQQMHMERWFGPGVPEIEELNKNVSLVLTGNNWILSYPRLLFPNIVELTGLHIKDKLDDLPSEIKTFLDDAPNGVVYFSLGSNVKSSELPKEFLNVFIESLAELKLKVLWKWEAESLQNQPKNVMVKKWLPQQEVLAHPKVRAFITQAGLQSLQEAVFYGVPVVLLPFFADQQYNARRAEDVGVGVKLEFDHLSKKTFLGAIHTVLDNPSYRKNMDTLSAVFRDHTEKSKRDAVWWLEYVARHGGAPFQRPASLDMCWFQLYNLDIIAAILFLLSAVCYICSAITKKLCVALCAKAKKKTPKKATKSKKRD